MSDEPKPIDPWRRGERALEAYYYSFDATGVREVDSVLAAVAFAGKAYHHTQDWFESDDEESPVDCIQRHADMAAEHVQSLEGQRDAARTALHHLAPWAEALLDAGLVRDERGWRLPGESPIIDRDGDTWRSETDLEVRYATEAEAAGAWLAAQGGDRG